MEREQRNAIIRWFTDFIDQEQFDYESKIAVMLQRHEPRLIINLDDLREYDNIQTTHRTEELLNEPNTHIPAFEEALKELVPLVANRRTLPPVADSARFFVGFDGPFGTHLLTPRFLNSSHIRKLICIEGIATRCKRCMNANSV
jgi:DNA replication licensing factor MCM3